MIKALILAGGFGTRLAPETTLKPKPMVDIGGRPILWHILKHMEHHGLREFFIAAGYLAGHIKRYFVDYHALAGSLTVSLSKGKVATHERYCEDWVVHIMDTGLKTNTGGRVKRLEPWLSSETFLVTYGDGVADVDLGQLLAFHRAHGRLATVTAVRPPARFGGLVLDGDAVQEFGEKTQVGDGWINGGFLVFEPGVFEYLEDDGDSLEADALSRIARDGELRAFRHEGFWQCVDTPREKRVLTELWEGGSPPWKVWA